MNPAATPIQPTIGHAPPLSFSNEPTAFSCALRPIAISASITENPMMNTIAA